MPKRKDIIDTEHYKIHWEHTTHIYSELEDYLRFMVHDGNIEKPTYDLMVGKLDELFDQYREIYQDFVGD